jgi:hypothetical protein
MKRLMQSGKRKNSGFKEKILVSELGLEKF